MSMIEINKHVVLKENRINQEPIHLIGQDIKINDPINVTYLVTGGSREITGKYIGHIDNFIIINNVVDQYVDTKDIKTLVVKNE